MSDAQLATLEDQIAAAKAELTRLRRKQRAIVARRASGKARGQSRRAQTLRAKYAPETASHGTIRRLAAEVGLSERQAHRILRDLKPVRSGSNGIPHGEWSRAAGRLLPTTIPAALEVVASPSPAAVSRTPSRPSRAGANAPTSKQSRSANRRSAGRVAECPNTSQSDLFDLPPSGNAPSRGT